MTSPADEIASKLRNYDGTDFEKAVAEAFAYLGLDSNWIGDDEADVDVEVYSRWTPSPFKAVIECNAKHENAEVGKDKVDQVRGNGKKHESEDYNLHLVVVGRPKFSENACTNSRDDVSLILSSDLEKLVLGHSDYCFSNDEIGEFFENWGVHTDAIEVLIEEKRQEHNRILSVCSLVIVVLENLQTETSVIDSGVLMNKLEVYGETLGVGIFDNVEMRRALLLLGPPFLNIVEIKDEGIKLRHVSLEETVLRLGKYGRIVLEKCKEIRKELSVARKKAENQ
ncbi:MAG: restriction endonuclease [Candidatus Thorarchaeota archaeon]